MKGIVNGTHYKTGKPIEISIEEGLVQNIENREGLQSERQIAPGFVDLQVNGFNGVDFNQRGLRSNEVKEITESLLKEGVTNYFPTLITNSDAHIRAAIKTIVKACKKDELINQSVRGIHLEGPFLSKEDGPRGAHPSEYIKPPDWDLICEWQALAEGRIKIITLSPEWPESISFIEKCVKAGILVSIGHTSATPSQIGDAVLAGAKMSTHLGNATHLMLPRHSNYIWEQLASENLWSTIIADGFHLPESVLSVFLKVKKEKTILISDSTKFAGLPSGSYSAHIGGEVELDQNGRLFMKDRPEMLAGSAQSLRWCIDHLVNSGLTKLTDALDMASLRPLELLEIDALYGFEKGKKADFIVFEINENKMKIIQTIKSGEVVYTRC